MLSSRDLDLSRMATINSIRRRSEELQRSLPPTLASLQQNRQSPAAPLRQSPIAPVRQNPPSMMRQSPPPSQLRSIPGVPSPLSRLGQSPPVSSAMRSSLPIPSRNSPHAPTGMRQPPSIGQSPPVPSGIRQSPGMGQSPALAKAPSFGQSFRPSPPQFKQPPSQNLSRLPQSQNPVRQSPAPLKQLPSINKQSPPQSMARQAPQILKPQPPKRSPVKQYPTPPMKRPAPPSVRQPLAKTNTNNQQMLTKQAKVEPGNLKQVEVECVAPYDEMDWVNIGKEKDGMKPHEVQYALALKPPYHLASFLKLQGNTTKGISATNNNTMVFVVLQGEVSVVLNTTQFQATKGDSFFVPPHNTYNIINLKAREAELFLVQYKYQGSLLDETNALNGS